MENRWEVRLAGFGGQGIILAGYLLGRAAALYDRQEACVSQSYGPEARGGACHADVIISQDSVLYPKVFNPNIFLLMSREAFEKYGRAPNGAIMLVDEDLVEGAGGEAYSIPATRTANQLGNRLGANVVMLGAFSAITGVVSREALEESIRDTVKPGLLDYNLQAFSLGFQHGEGLVAGEKVRCQGGGKR